MVHKLLLRPERLRVVPGQCSWVDHRLVRKRHLERCTSEAPALCLFLVTVAERLGSRRRLSFFVMVLCYSRWRGRPAALPAD